MCWGFFVAVYPAPFAKPDPAAGALTSKRQHTVPDLEPYRMYWLRVIAVNTAGESLPSDVLMARAA